MYHLPFLDPGYDHVPLRLLSDISQHDVPHKRGVYVLLARTGVRFSYPRGRSPVFYIGMSSDLHTRLSTHAKYSLEAAEDRKYTLYYAVYEYAAAFGCRYTYMLLRPGERAAHVESCLLAMFAEHYRSWPVANTKGGWEHLNPPEMV